MNDNAKYNLLTWFVTLSVALTLFSLGIIALIEKEIFISWRAVSGLSQGIGAVVIGWMFLGGSVVILSYQLKVSKFWLSSYAIYVCYFLALVGYVLYNIK